MGDTEEHLKSVEKLLKGFSSSQGTSSWTHTFLFSCWLLVICYWYQDVLHSINNDPKCEIYQGFDFFFCESLILLLSSMDYAENLTCKILSCQRSVKLDLCQCSSLKTDLQFLTNPNHVVWQSDSKWSSSTLFERGRRHLTWKTLVSVKLPQNHSNSATEAGGKIPIKKWARWNDVSFTGEAGNKNNISLLVQFHFFQHSLNII